ncbi:hypothetical protein BAUCODRAFT_39757 [Baudoinia panamericana UAMH 10762]|uniref:Uncharacterized protein n=1 Tax=Baudoinia panamericana (strain UAMH 10762) TaxID=717646 RepID=M2MWJ6_BAUPA|nr:uncharacterized protein BAUCODRAFT_39757 [Baudoinia panamericana UAMH 10762]EMC90959.1 hypothetical protein BAUCODRAFT_39757 [Baudoinia panamericana UAMH 10762]
MLGPPAEDTCLNENSSPAPYDPHGLAYGGLVDDPFLLLTCFSVTHFEGQARVMALHWVLNAVPKLIE